MWEQLNRVIKKNWALVLFWSEPFSSALRMSNIKNYKYDWIWEKSRALWFTNAKNKPMNKHELISVFSEGTTANKSNRRMPYYPQWLLPFWKKVSWIKKCRADELEWWHKFWRPWHKESFIQDFTNYPTQILKYSNEWGTVHPTQKPVALIEYLIKTYTQEWETVLDFTMWSWTTWVACKNTNRNFIGIEMDKWYFDIATERINNL